MYRKIDFVIDFAVTLLGLLGFFIIPNQNNWLNVVICISLGSFYILSGYPLSWFISFRGSCQKVIEK